MSREWYGKVAADSHLDQGDLIPDCPIASWRGQAGRLGTSPDALSILKSRLEFSLVDVIVMTQTCDLAQRKAHEVILCPHYSLGDYREVWNEAQQNRSDRGWRKFLDHIVKGYVWNLAVLNSEDGDGYHADHRIVDFHEVFSLPRDFLESWTPNEAEGRLRLLPPYREHLSQAFARFFMRVGLPTDIHRAWQ